MVRQNARKRASIYVRLSRAATETNLSIGGMERDLRDLADRLGADVAAVHVDDGLSGGIRNRPAFRQWLADARHGRADILAAWSIDRMTREGVSGGGADILDTIEETGVRLVDYSGLDSTTPGFRMGFVVKAEVAREELERMRERSKARARRAREAGQWSAGAAPYGYRIVRDDAGKPRLAVEPDEARVIGDAASRIVAGTPLARIVRELNDAGVTPRRAARWTSTSLLRVLTGPTVRGYAQHGGDVLRGNDGMPRRLWEPVLDAETASQVAACLAPQPGRGRRAGSRTDTRLLSGLLTCASCGRTLRASSSQGVARYACPAPEAGCGRRATINAARVEAWAADHLLDEFTRSMMYTEMVPVASGGTVEAAEIDEAIAACVAELATHADPDAFTRLQALQERRAAVAAQPRETRWVARVTGRTVGEEWDARDTPGRNALLTSGINLDRVVVSAAAWPSQPVGERVTPKWHEDSDEHPDSE